MSERPDPGHSPAGRDPVPEPAERPTGADAARRSPWKMLIVVVVLFGALAAVYAINPSARSYAMKTIQAVRDTADAALNPAPERDLDLVAEAAVYWQQQDWPKIVDAYGRLVEKEPDNHGAWLRLAMGRHNLEDYVGAIEAHLRAVESPRIAATAWYNLACEYAMTGRTDEALGALDRAMRHGFRNFNLMRTDDELAAIRDDERFVIPPGPTRESFTTSEGVLIEYWRVLPKDFDPEKTYPCLVGLNGNVQSMNVGRGALNSFWGMQAYFREWIVVTPAPPSGKQFYFGDGHLVLGEFLEHIASEFDIEGGKFHVAGYSNGGTSAFRVATEFPDRVQSVTAFPGYATPGQVFDRLERLRGMRITMFWGETDQGPARTESLRTGRRLRELGIDATTREFSGEPHIPQSLVGEPFMHYLDWIRGIESDPPFDLDS